MEKRVSGTARQSAFGGRYRLASNPSESVAVLSIAWPKTLLGCNLKRHLPSQSDAGRCLWGQLCSRAARNAYMLMATDAL